MADDGVSEYVEAERRFYGNRWDSRITIIMHPPETPKDLMSIDLPVEQAEQLGKDILELVRIAKVPDGTDVT